MFCTQRTGQEAPHGAPQPLVDYFNRELAMDDGDNNATDMGFQWKKKCIRSLETPLDANECMMNGLRTFWRHSVGDVLRI
jgi:hypothetical protein